MTSREKAKRELVRELVIKARFLNRFGLFSLAVFLAALWKLYPVRQESRLLFIFSIAMTVISLAFFLLMRRIGRVLDNNPSDADILKWGEFLELYYVPKFILKKRKNPFIVEDDED